MNQPQPANPGLPNVFDLQHAISAYETVLLDLARNGDWFDRCSADVIPSGLLDRRQFLQAKLDLLANQTENN